jgi:hypothetical protein
MRNRSLLRLGLVAALAAALALPSPAHAIDGRVVKRGDCTRHSDWKLEVRKEDGGRLRVRYEIEGGRSGQEWHIFLSDNGVGIFSGTRTSASNGYVEVRLRRSDRAGSDTIKAAANNVDSGESCAGKATL